MRTWQSALRSCLCPCHLPHDRQKTLSFCLRLNSTCRNRLDVRDVNKGAKIDLTALVSNARVLFNGYHETPKAYIS